MSRFDEQPDGDPHGECAAEIDKLKALNAELAAALVFITRQFTKTPSSLKDSEARCKAHAALAKNKGETA